MSALNGGTHPEGTSPPVGRRLAAAFQFLTRLPTPPVRDINPADFSASSVFFPLVGMVVGLCILIAVMLGRQIDPAVAALAGVITWVGITGALHLDGLGDVSDGFGAAHKDPERFREVVRDSRAGNFAIVAIALQIAAKIVLLSAISVSNDLWPIVLVPAWARWGALVWGRALPALWRGTGERFAENIGWASILIWAAVLSVASAWIAPNLLAGLIITPLITLFWRWQLGGISGDCLGASIEVTESLLLLALLVRTA